jgi:hypothetical protein
MESHLCILGTSVQLGAGNKGRQEMGEGIGQLRNTLNPVENPGSLGRGRGLLQQQHKAAQFSQKPSGHHIIFSRYVFYLNI